MGGITGWLVLGIRDRKSLIAKKNRHIQGFEPRGVIYVVRVLWFFLSELCIRVVRSGTRRTI
jgi:hypothetical protein